MKSPKCLIIDPMHESLFSMLKEIGWESDYQPAITREAIQTNHLGISGIDRYEVRPPLIVILLGDNPTVKFIGRAGAGLDIT